MRMILKNTENKKLFSERFTGFTILQTNFGDSIKIITVDMMIEIQFRINVGKKSSIQRKKKMK